MLVSDSIEPRVKKVLDRTASTIAELGYKVIRVEELETGIGRGIPGFINSLIFNNTVYMPTYSKGLEAPSQRIAELERKAQLIYESLGYKVIKIDASGPINGMGAIHCLTCTGNFSF